MKNARLTRPITLVLLMAVLWSQIGPLPGLVLAQPIRFDSPAPASASPVADSQAAPAALAPWLPFDEAFTQRVTEPDGGQALLISATPLHYRDAQGAWQPIDQRFEMVEGGFANDNNLLQIWARADQVVVAARY